VDVLLRRAEALIEVRRAAEAAPMLGQHLAEHPDSFRAWALLARCYSILGRSAEMLDAAQRA